MITNKEYNDMSEVPNIPYGTYNIDINTEWHNQNAEKLLNSDFVKFTGANNINKFCKFPQELREDISSYLNNKLEMSFDWTAEYFQSSEPAGLHTDYISTPNSWKPKEIGVITHDCHLVIGVIIPLCWNSKQPYTVNYNRRVDTPRKLIYRKGEMRYADTGESISYRDKWTYHPEVLEYNPENTEYYREYADLTIHSAYKWEIGTMMVFDTRRWHSSSWFLSDNTVQNPPKEYKRSIIAFGSIDIIREEFR